MTYPTTELQRFAAACLLKAGFVNLPIDEALEGFALDAAEEDLVRACWARPKMKMALHQFRKAYEEGKEQGLIPILAEPWYD